MNISDTIINNLTSVEVIDRTIQQSDVQITKIPIGEIIVLFVAYIVSHILIGYFLDKTKKEVMLFPTNVELVERQKWLTILFKWFPAVAVIVIIFILYS